jgi:transposase
MYLDLEIRRVKCRRCGVVKQERFDFLANNPFYTKRFAMYIGERFKSSTINDIAKEFRLDWKTVKEFDKHYMQEQLRRAPKPRVIGVDEISVRKGHDYRIVVTDLERRCPIWFGRKDRTEESMNMFYEWLGPLKTKRIRLVVMDMWKPFENSASANIPQAAILYDKFHIIRHLGEAIDKIRKQEYKRLSGNKQRFIKGQKYNLLFHQENLTLSAKMTLKTLLKANKRLNTTYVLKESFGQLWDYRSTVWARKFFDNWKASLR